MKVLMCAKFIFQHCGRSFFTVPDFKLQTSFHQFDSTPFVFLGTVLKEWLDIHPINRWPAQVDASASKVVVTVGAGPCARPHSQK